MVKKNSRKTLRKRRNRYSYKKKIHKKMRGGSYTPQEEAKILEEILEEIRIE